MAKATTTKKRRKLPDAIQDTTRSKFWAMMLYSDTGVGKTRFISTAVECGMKVLIIRPPTDHTDSIRVKGVKEWVVRSWDDMLDVLEFARHDGDQFDIIALDTISLWQDAGLDDIWDIVLAEKPHRARYGLDKQEYGINMFRLGQWVRHMVGCQLFNFIVTAHITEGNISGNPDEDEKLTPFVQGKNMSAKVCAMMNLVGYMHVNSKGKRVIEFGASDEFYAKDQFDAFNKGRLVDPTFPKFMERIDAVRGGAAPRSGSKTSKAKTTTSAKKGK